MPVRVNKAKKFNGSSYVGTDALDTLLANATFANNTLTLIGDAKEIEGDPISARTVDLSTLVGITSGGTLISVSSNNINAGGLTTFVGTPSATKIVTTDSSSHLAYTNAIVTAIGETPLATNIPTESAVKAYVDGKSINVAAGNGVEVITSNATGAGSPLNPLIKADVDGTTIVFAGDTDGSKKLATGLKILKKGTANEGYAATYYLADANGTQLGTTDNEINILKDQFLKNVAFIASATSDDVTAAGSNPGFVVGDPVLKFTFELTGTTDDTDSVLYVPVKELVDVYTAGNYVDATAIQSNVIKVNVGNGIDATNSTNITVLADSSSDKVYATKGSAADVITVGANGVKIANIQAAIDLAVNDEHALASAAIDSLDNKIDTIQGATSGAVDDLNSRISSVAVNAQTAIQSVGAAVDTLDGKVETAISDVNDKVESAIDSTVTNVGNALTSTVASVNAKVGSGVASVNTQVGTAISTVSAVIDNVQTAVGTFKGTVSATIDSAQSAVNDFKTDVNAKVSAVVDNVNSAISANVDNRNTQLESAVEVIEIPVTPTGSNGIYTASVTAKYIIGVFGGDSMQIYPEIQKTDNGFSLSADYGETQSSVEAWTVIAARDLPTIGTLAQAVTSEASYTSATNGVAFTATNNNAGYSDASYSDASATAPVAVDAPDASYTSDIDVSGTTVADGDAATAPATQADVAEGALTYKNA